MYKKVAARDWLSFSHFFFCFNRMTDQDGFVTVEKFKYKSVSKKKRNKKYTFKDSDDWTLEDIQAKLKERK
jgi:hypothetical protein